MPAKVDPRDTEAVAVGDSFTDEECGRAEQVSSTKSRRSSSGGLDSSTPRRSSISSIMAVDDDVFNQRDATKMGDTPTPAVQLKWDAPPISYDLAAVCRGFLWHWLHINMLAAGLAVAGVVPVLIMGAFTRLALSIAPDFTGTLDDLLNVPPSDGLFVFRHVPSFFSIATIYLTAFVLARVLWSRSVVLQPALLILLPGLLLQLCVDSGLNMLAYQTGSYPVWGFFCYIALVTLMLVAFFVKMAAYHVAHAAAFRCSCGPMDT